MSNSCKRNCVGVHDLPHDVVEDILTRLPVKYLLRCKLVSETYSALIKSPSFINKHLLFHRNNNNNLITLIRGKGNIVSLLPRQTDITYNVPPLQDNSHIIQIVGSCNGLLCALACAPLINHPLLWNPATREHMLLPAFKLDYYRATGFGYDAASNDYKLVMISSDHDDVKVEIWTLRTNSWREIEIGTTHALPANLMKDYAITQVPGVLLRGKLYWLAHPPLLGHPNHDHLAIICFDLVDDSFRMQILDDATGKDGGPWIGFGKNVFDFNGSLALSVAWYCDRNENNGMASWTVNVWVLVGEELSSSTWTKKISVGPFMFPAWGWTSLSIIYVNDKVVVTDNYCSKFIWYDLHTKDQMEIKGDSTSRGHTPWCYSESLVSLNRNFDV